jgi:hypothetical protein
MDNSESLTITGIVSRFCQKQRTKKGQGGETLWNRK